MERIIPDEFPTTSQNYDSVSNYSTQDFSQISDYSDDDITEIHRTLSRQVLRDHVDDTDVDAHPMREKHSTERINRTVDQNLGKTKKTSNEVNSPTSRSSGRTTVASNRADFDTTNARIHGDYQEKEKRGIRVLQPPGGFSSGLW